jgi:exopolysaccharide production protein ExoQ
MAWLLLEERKRFRAPSSTIWIPFIWLAIIASRPVSLWFGLNPDLKNSDDYLQGSPFDRFVFLLLISLALIVLARRRLPWRTVVSENRYIFLFFGYLLVSTLWSPYPFTAFKRWIKDFGNIIMVLVVFTDQKPFAVLESMFIRCASILVPLSALFIKYYPELGRTYNVWSWQPSYGGVTTSKNMLGMIVFVFACFLLWSLRDLTVASGPPPTLKTLRARLLLMLITLWLLFRANSSTALAATIFVAILLVATRFNLSKTKRSNIGPYILICFLIFLSILLTPILRETVTSMLGRNITLTGRTDIWNRVLKEDINPLFGEGFYSFWLGERNRRLSEGFYYDLGEAHNGYIETYLNAGLIGLCFFLVLLQRSYKRIMQAVNDGEEFAIFRLILFFSVLIYAITESIFNRMNPIWFAFISVIMNPYPGKCLRTSPRTDEERTFSLFPQTMKIK